MGHLEGRILAIDLGRKRVGLAISDPLGMFAVGLETLEINARSNLLEELRTIISAQDVKHVVLGLPRKMSGEEGPEAQKARRLARLIEEKIGLSVTLLDERFTSVLAHQTLREQGIQPSRQKGLVDQAAAKRILQDYLDQRHGQ